MIDDLGSYSLADFLQFSPDTYHRLFELYNRDVWPLHLLAIALGGAIVWMIVRGQGGRMVCIILAVLWAWVGWAFLLEHCATIMIAAPYFGALFGAEAFLLAGLGAAGKLRLGAPSRKTLPASESERARRAAAAPESDRTFAIALTIFALAIHPLIELVSGRNWTELSVFGLAPDPTAIATLGLLLAVHGRMRWIVVVPALIWCIITLLTSLAMNSFEALNPAIALIVVSLATIARARTAARR